MIAAIKIRGSVDASEDISRTLESLGLEKKNQCRFVEEDDEAVKGMLEKAKDYITYGTVDDEVLEELEFDAGEVVSLSPPSGGFKNTRKNVNEGGALGRRENVSDLLRKMI
jgi:large subunit ribosomal protein L30